MKQGRLGSLLTILMLLLAASAAIADPIKAVSWNIRLDTPHDAELAWPHRAGNVIRQLQQHPPTFFQYPVVRLALCLFFQTNRNL